VKAFTTERREAAFWAKVNKDGPIPAFAPHLGNCWVWTAGKDRRGYGQFGNGDRHHHIPAHFFLLGRAPDGLEWDHLCHVPACIRPDHLEAVTHAENVRRGLATLRSECPKGHPYSPENTARFGRRGRRVCRICQRETNRRRDHKLRTAKATSPETCCVVAGCTSHRYARQMCQVHYGRWKRSSHARVPERRAVGR